MYTGPITIQPCGILPGTAFHAEIHIPLTRQSVNSVLSMTNLTDLLFYIAAMVPGFLDWLLCAFSACEIPHSTHSKDRTK